MRNVRYYLAIVMIPVLGFAALLQSTAVARLKIAGVKPDLVLLALLAWTLIYGGQSGVVLAFVGGIALDIFSGGPMGASSLSLMAASAVTGIGHGTLYRYNPLVPVVVTMVGTVVYSFAYLGILFVLGLGLPFMSTVTHVIVPSILYNATLMLCATPFLNRVPDNQDAMV